VIRRAVAVKITVVEQDRLESGIRAILNLGHTFAHAVEQVSGYRWKHGEAVAAGQVAAARLSERLGLCQPGLAEMVESVLAALGLPVRYADMPPGPVWEAMTRDKKWRDGAATFVLLKAIGEPVVVRDVPRADVIPVLEAMREG
jgi:3-dehydroquinate synthetase